MGTPWNDQLIEQVDGHWQRQLRERLTDLTDQEYFWEPASNTWNVRPRGTGSAPIQAGSGDMTIDFAVPEPSPAPVTTIAWRLGHLIVGVLGARNAAHFEGPPIDYDSFDYASTAQEALAQLDAQYTRWIDGVRALGEAGLNRPCGQAEPYPEWPMSALVLHINREVIHHGAEIALLRDLYANTNR